MQINRMFEIAFLLLRRERVTAKELAARFSVSTRTIYRDLDALSAAGIPVYADRGRNGGLRLMEGFALSKTMLTSDEQSEILSALKGMRAASVPEAESALKKLSSLFKKSPVGWVDVDFNSWSNHDERFPLIKAAILEKRRIAFDYHARNGQSSARTVEPLQLWFKHRSWYLKAYCLERADYRLFRYSRMKNLKLLDERFERELPQDVDFEVPAGGAPVAELKLRIDASQAYRVYDELDEGEIERCENGDFLVKVSYIEDSWLYGFILSFGPYIEVVSPERIRGIIAALWEKSFTRYQNMTRRCHISRGIMASENSEGAENMENVTEMKFCQSCAMPMGETDEMYGTEGNGAKSADYCKYCYEDGKFHTDETMEEMIESCIPHVLDHYGTEERARAEMGRIFPMLKRWAK